MKTTLRINGGRELARRLQQLPAVMSRKVKVAALREAAEPIRKNAEAHAPVDDEGSDPHLADHIVVWELSERNLESRGRDTETVVEVGPALKPEDVFYGIFQEFGTKHHPAQPFMRPAFDEEHRESLDRLVDELWWALKHGTDRF